MPQGSNLYQTEADNVTYSAVGIPYFERNVSPIPILVEN